MLGAGGCSAELQLNLVVNDPCNQQVLGDQALGLEHLEVVLTSPSLPQPEGTIWRRGDGQGQLDDLTPVADATLSVVGRASTGGGEAGAVVAGISVGKLDLSGGLEENPIELSVVFGKVGRFFRTTDGEAATGGQVVCTSLGAERHGHTATLLADGRVFIAGGIRQSPTLTTYWESTELYDPRSGVFEFGPRMEYKKQTWVRQAHTATLLQDGRVLIAGGVGLVDEAVDTWKVALVFDPTSGTFADPVPMREQRAYHSATLLEDGRVLIAGGRLGSSERQTTEIFDPRANSFCDGPSLSPQPRAHHAAVRIGASTVALIGGQGSGSTVGAVQFVEVAGCSQGRTVAGPTLQTPRSYPNAALIPGQDAILVAGGYAAVVAAPEGAAGSDAIEVIKLNSANLAQSTIACDSLRLMTPRGAAALAEVPGGFLLIGGIGAPNTALPTAETLSFGDLGSCDAAIDWTGGDLAVARAGAVATPLVGGDVLVTGGFSVTGGQLESLADGEIYVRPR